MNFGLLTPEQYKTTTICDVAFVIYYVLWKFKIMQNIHNGKWLIILRF